MSISSQAIYTIIENGETTHLYSHWGANSLTPMVRLQEALNIQMENNKSITDIFAHLSSEGSYLDDKKAVDSIFQKLELTESDFEELKKEPNSLTEMFVTLDIDNQEYTQSYNRNYAPYAYMERANFRSTFEVGLKNMQTIMDYSEKLEFSDFWDAVNYLDEKTGVGKFLKDSMTLYETIQNTPESLKELIENDIREV